MKHVEAKEDRKGLKEYINIQHPSDTWHTALHVACEDNNYYNVKLLLEHGASSGIRDIFKNTPENNLSKSLSSNKIRSLFGQKFNKISLQKNKLKVTRVQHILSQKYGINETGRIRQNLMIL